MRHYISRSIRPLLSAVLFWVSFSLLHAAETATEPAPVQVDVSKLFNTRVVTTFTDGKVIPLQEGVDKIAGVVTQAAATALGSTNQHNVPGDGKFPANADHPEVVLHYSDADGTSNQVRRSVAEDDYSFEVPPRHYRQMFLFYTSGAAGPAPLQIVLTYQDGSTEDRAIVVPDWYKLLKPTDKGCVYLASDLSKWDKENHMHEKDHHAIFGLDVDPAPDKILTQIKVHKTRPIVVFWGATGQPVD